MFTRRSFAWLMFAGGAVAGCDDGRVTGATGDTGFADTVLADGDAVLDADDTTELTPDTGIDEPADASSAVDVTADGVLDSDAPLPDAADPELDVEASDAVSPEVDVPANPPVCGNEITEEGEACDDGNEDPFDGCDACEPGGVCRLSSDVGLETNGSIFLGMLADPECGTIELTGSLPIWLEETAVVTREVRIIGARERVVFSPYLGQLRALFRVRTAGRVEFQNIGFADAQGTQGVAVGVSDVSEPGTTRLLFSDVEFARLSLLAETDRSILRGGAVDLNANATAGIEARFERCSFSSMYINDVEPLFKVQGGILSARASAAPLSVSLSEIEVGGNSGRAASHQLQGWFMSLQCSTDCSVLMHEVHVSDITMQTNGIEGGIVHVVAEAEAEVLVDVTKFTIEDTDLGAQTGALRGGLMHAAARDRARLSLSFEEFFLGRNRIATATGRVEGGLMWLEATGEASALQMELQRGTILDASVEGPAIYGGIIAASSKEGSATLTLNLTNVSLFAGEFELPYRDAPLPALAGGVIAATAAGEEASCRVEFTYCTIQDQALRSRPTPETLEFPLAYGDSVDDGNVSIQFLTSILPGNALDEDAQWCAMTGTQAELVSEYTARPTLFGCEDRGVSPETDFLDADTTLEALAEIGGFAPVRSLPQDSPLHDALRIPCPYVSASTASDAHGNSRPQGAGCEPGAVENPAAAPVP